MGWSKNNGAKDSRGLSKRIAPANKLSDDERNRILALVNEEKYRDLSPCKIVPLLADEGIYVASESTFYRLLREVKQLAHRQRPERWSLQTRDWTCIARVSLNPNKGLKTEGNAVKESSQEKRAA